MRRGVGGGGGETVGPLVHGPLVSIATILNGCAKHCKLQVRGERGSKCTPPTSLVH